MEVNPASAQSANVEYEKKMLRLSRIRTFFMFLMVAGLFAVIIFVLPMGAQLNRILLQAESTFTQLNGIAADIGSADLPQMFGEINVLVEQGQAAASSAAAGVEEMMGTLDELDIETLNKSIADLHAVIEPLSRFFSR
ncbi:MAG TPA: hypothetical protein VN366_11505 [Feifaniaceae bacterium]|nr:hypothetical protein [Feifaniaceae bacterium]